MRRDREKRNSEIGQETGRVPLSFTTLPLPALLYEALSAFIDQFKKETAASGQAVPKDSAIFAVLVYVARVGSSSTNGRPRSRLFLELLRAGTPQAAARFDLPACCCPFSQFGAPRRQLEDYHRC